MSFPARPKILVHPVCDERGRRLVGVLRLAGVRPGRLRGQGHPEPGLGPPLPRRGPEAVEAGEAVLRVVLATVPLPGVPPQLDGGPGLALGGGRGGRAAAVPEEEPALLVLVDEVPGQEGVLTLYRLVVTLNVRT